MLDGPSPGSGLLACSHKNSISRSIPTNFNCSVGPYLEKINLKKDIFGFCFLLLFFFAKLTLFFFYIPIIKEKLFTWLNGSFCKNSYPMVTINHHHFSITIWIDGMISKTYLITFSSCIHNKIYKNISLLSHYYYFFSYYILRKRKYCDHYMCCLWTA